jgi:flagellar biosynthetic protein FliQ
MTLSFIPKILGVCVVVIVGGPWMVSVIVDYTTALLQNLPLLVH